MPRTTKQLDQDHDTLTELIAVTRGMAEDIKGMRGELEGVNGKLGETQLAVAQLKVAADDRATIASQHNEMYGFYSTFKQFLWPLMLSGPVSAIVSAVATYLLVRGG